MSNSNMAVANIVAAALVTTLAVSSPLQASETGAFIGGVFATKLLGSIEQRTKAEQDQAYESTRTAQQTQHVQQAPTRSSAPTGMTAQQKLDQLDKLAAGGYITPAEYKARREAILNSM